MSSMEWLISQLKRIELIEQEQGADPNMFLLIAIKACQVRRRLELGTWSRGKEMRDFELELEAWTRDCSAQKLERQITG